MKYIISNWKAYITAYAEAQRLVQCVQKKKMKKNIRWILCPPTFFLDRLSSVHSKKFFWGAQDVSSVSSGPYTGETSTNMLKASSVSYVILGHSERRLYNNETDTIINAKIKSALKAGLKIILCVGERIREDQQGIPESVGVQLRAALSGVTPHAITRHIIVAYEPIWAIGTGVTDTPQDTLCAALYLRKTIGDLYGHVIGKKLKVVYGGSVNASNIHLFINQLGIDGVLIGHASTQIKELEMM